MGVINFNWRRIFQFFIGIASLFVYNEFLVYYVVLLRCSWPTLDPDSADMSISPSHIKEPLKVMFLADTHLLGSKEGHWFDKLRREWQMERSFKSSMSLFSPEAVFILGDLFDEGKWCGDVEFHSYTTRFKKMFSHGEDTQLVVVAGNHDIGFHYAIDNHKRRRFSSAFESPSVQMVRMKDNVFVLLNSMAFEGDRCDMCREAEDQLHIISQSLKCAQGTSGGPACGPDDNYLYTRPILLQHFPMFRKSDKNCTGPDAAPPEEINMPFRPKMDCLSRVATKFLFDKLNPRLIIGGHTHHGCYRKHPNGAPEWSIAAFSWRYKKTPTFLLATISNNNYSVKKCFLPNETTVIVTYIIGVIICFLWLLLPRNAFVRKWDNSHVPLKAQ